MNELLYTDIAQQYTRLPFSMNMATHTIQNWYGICCILSNSKMNSLINEKRDAHREDAF
jgi:hypothetical protein